MSNLKTPIVSSVVSSASFSTIYNTLAFSKVFTSILSNPFKDATVAYSLRDLGLGATNVVRVRRSSDNIEQDFTAAEITDGTLEAFCGINNGFVSVWYDQKNLSNLNQTSASSQPRIVNNGALIIVNGKPSIDFNINTTTVLNNLLPNSNNQPNSYFSVVKTNQLNIQQSIMDGITSDARNLIAFTSANEFQLFAGSLLASSGVTLNQKIVSSFFNTTDTSLFTNNVNKISNQDVGNNSINGLKVGNDFNGGQNFKGVIQEIIYYNKDVIGKRVDIENNINSYYGIY